jgi:hypothetical protein
MRAAVGCARRRTRVRVSGAGCTTARTVVPTGPVCSRWADARARERDRLQLAVNNHHPRSLMVDASRPAGSCDILPRQPDTTSPE